MVKIKDIDETNIDMLYRLLKATENRHIFTAKNIFLDKIDEELKESKFNNIENEKVEGIYSFYKTNWVNEDTGELFITDAKKEDYKKEIEEKRGKRLINVNR